MEVMLFVFRNSGELTVASVAYAGTITAHPLRYVPEVTA